MKLISTRIKSIIAVLIILFSITGIFTGCVTDEYLNEATSAAYNDGHSDGIEEGYKSGREDGYSDGYQEGFNDGEDSVSYYEDDSEYTEPTETTVYVTKTGSKYHRSGCQYLKKSKIPMALSDARQSYGPCSKCTPPR